MRDTGNGQTARDSLNTDRPAVLRRVNLFAALNASALHQLSNQFEPFRVQRGTALCRCGDSGEYLYVIVSGSFAVFACASRSGEEVRIATLRAGDYFGEMALLTGEPRSATVTAETDSVVLRLSKSAFLELLKRCPAVEAAVIASLCGRLKTSNQEVVQMSQIAVSTVGRTLEKLPPEQRREALMAVDESLAAAPLRASSTTGPLASVLSPREREVASLVAQGLSNSDIATRLVISTRTAETHVNHILNRLGYSSRAQIAAWAVAQGLVTDLQG